MARFGCVILLALGTTAGAAGGYWYARLPTGVLASAVAPESAAAERKILYYRDPSSALARLSDEDWPLAINMRACAISVMH